MEATTVCAHCGKPSEGRPLVCPTCGEDPRVQGRYRLEAEIGRGGSAVTWRARREPGGDPVCLKELRWATMGDLDDERRFAREGELLEGLDHPAIPKHYGAFAWGEGRAHALYIAQELVVGDNLEHERRTQGYTSDDLLAIGVELADVLSHLHLRHPPIVHRDIKPSNIMRRVDGRLLLIDFGAARLAGLGASPVSVAGTFGYMAPEQLRGEAGPPADIYGLGMTLAVLASGGAPEALLDAGNTPDLDRIGHGPGFAPLPSGLKALLAAMVARDPAARPSAREVSRRCKELLRKEPERPPSRRLERPAAAVSEAQAQVVKRVRRAVIVSGLISVVGGVLVFTAAPSSEAPVVAVAPQVSVTSSVSVTTSSSSSVTVEPLVVEPKVAARPEPEEPTAAELADRCRGPAPPQVADPAKRAAACEALFALAQKRGPELASLSDWPAPLESACDQGSEEACHALALTFAQGVGVEVSRTRTYGAFARGCGAGHLESCASQGRMAMKGDGTPQDWVAALGPLEKACLGDDLVACVDRGKILADGGHGVRPDRAMALALFDNVCQRGDRIACDNVDAMIGNNWGLPATASERATLFTTLCDHRSKVACFRLGDLLARGSGTKKDPAAARERYTRACDLGLPEACNKLR